jgi:hypothetical protein
MHGVTAGSITAARDGCILPKDTIRVQPETVFVPTFVRETINVLATGNVPVCPPDYNMVDNGVCSQESRLFIPGAENRKIKFSHRFDAQPEVTAFVTGLTDLHASSKSTDASGFSTGIKTVFFTYSGEVFKSWAPTEWIELTMKDLLSAADYDDVGPRGNLNLDQQYSRSEQNVPDNVLPTMTGCKPEVCGVGLRQTGVAITIDIQITDEGTCRHVGLQEDFDVENDGGPVACMFAHAERTWTKQGSHHLVGYKGGFKTVEESGIRIKFRTKGSVHLRDFMTVSQNFTVAIVWIQIPLFVVYYFTMLCLGHLSSVYARVVQENVNLGDACKGLATRLVSHSACYMELQDAPEGITKAKLLERFKSILGAKEGITDKEIRIYVDFIFEGMQAMGEGQDAINDTINIQEFCQACATNEPLSFDSMVKLFDKDRKMSCLEKLFLDSSIRSVLAAAARDHELHHVDEADTSAFNDKEAITSIANKVDDLQTKAQRIIDVTQANTDADKELYYKALSIARERRSAGRPVIDPIIHFTPTEDPKPDQRESVCSIADEDDPSPPQR